MSGLVGTEPPISGMLQQLPCMQWSPSPHESPSPPGMHSPAAQVSQTPHSLSLSWQTPDRQIPGEHGSSVQLPPSFVGILTQPSEGSHSLRLQRSAISSRHWTAKPPEHVPPTQMAPCQQASALQDVPFGAVVQALSWHCWHAPQGLPHSSRSPHSVGTGPQRPSQLMVEMHPQTPCVPLPPHVCGGVQAPQSLMAPQSSVKVPQLSPAAVQDVVAWQTQALPMQAKPGEQSALEQHWPGARQKPLQTSCPVGQQSSSP